ncbi:MAG TPA: Calx-beta domain-containing protein [Kofleriaceae bacterium]|nr:Calx-beta domain-containing protein [Kofleriaceae bacterium]
MRLALTALVGLVLVTGCRDLLGFEEPEVRDDGGTSAIRVGFRAPQSLADEQAGTVRVAVVLSQPSDAPVTVAYAVVGGTASAGDDFAVSGTSLAFAPGELRQEIAVAITSDAVAEPDETIELELRAATGASIDQATHTLTVSAELLPRVAFAEPSSRGSETTPSTLAVTLDRAVTVPVTVGLVVEGTASAADYAFTGSSVTFAAGATTATIALDEIDDALDEDPETVVLTLQDPSLGVLVGAIATTTHTIDDDDAPPAIQLDATTTTANENAGSVQIGVSLSAPSGKSVAVDYGGMFTGSASPADAAITGAPGPLVFQPGEVTKQLEVTLANDAADEATETFTLALANPSNATLGARTTNTVTIVDDDAPPAVAFAAAATTVTEDPTMVTVTVVLSAASEKAISVPVVRSGTASTADATVPTTSVAFAPGTTSQTLTVTIAEDLLDEDPETVVLALGTPTNATPGAITSHTVTIADDDNAPIVRFDPNEADQTVLEGNPLPNARIFTYAVVLSAPSGKPITVPIAVTGDADDPVDYTIPTALPLVFAPGETRKTIDVRVVADTIAETGLDDLEDVILTISATPTNATRGVPAVRTHTIDDDD